MDDKEKFMELFNGISNELPSLIGGFLDHLGTGVGNVSGVSIDMIVEKDGNVISDKLHVLLANDYFGMLFQEIAFAGRGNPEFINKIIALINEHNKGI